MREQKWAPSLKKIEPSELRFGRVRLAPASTMGGRTRRLNSAAGPCVRSSSSSSRSPAGPDRTGQMNTRPDNWRRADGFAHLHLAGRPVPEQTSASGQLARRPLQRRPPFSGGKLPFYYCCQSDYYHWRRRRRPERKEEAERAPPPLCPNGPSLGLASLARPSPLRGQQPIKVSAPGKQTKPLLCLSPSISVLRASPMQPDKWKPQKCVSTEESCAPHP